MRSRNSSTLRTTTPASRNRLGTLASRIAPSSELPASVARSHAPTASACNGSIGPTLGSCATRPPLPPAARTIATSPASVSGPPRPRHPAAASPTAASPTTTTAGPAIPTTQPRPAAPTRATRATAARRAPSHATLRASTRTALARRVSSRPGAGRRVPAAGPGLPAAGWRAPLRHPRSRSSVTSSIPGAIWPGPITGSSSCPLSPTSRPDSATGRPGPSTAATGASATASSSAGGRSSTSGSASACSWGASGVSSGPEAGGSVVTGGVTPVMAIQSSPIWTGR
jgi:hypothetical protein